MAATTTTNSKSQGQSHGRSKTTGGKAATKKPSQKTSSQPSKTVKSAGLLDTAEQVLKRKKSPMRCKQIIEIMLDEQLWSTKGKTPHATLYAAIHREIQKKGKASRFQKVDRGMFALK